MGIEEDDIAASPSALVAHHAQVGAEAESSTAVVDDTLVRRSTARFQGRPLSSFAPGLWPDCGRETTMLDPAE
jgi:hypothetical protein